eukprot:UN14539
MHIISLLFIISLSAYEVRVTAFE